MIYVQCHTKYLAVRYVIIYFFLTESLEGELHHILATARHADRKMANS